MYLRGKTVKGRGFDSGYENLLPPLLSDDKMSILIKRLRTGDDAVIEELIVQHLRLVIHIVTKYVASFPEKSDDLMGVAALALTEAVKRFPFKAVDDNLAAYISSDVHGRLSTFIREQDRVIKISTHGFNAAINKSANTNVSVSSCIADTSLNVDSLVLGTDDEQRTKDQYISVYDDHTTIQIEEILSKCCLTRFEFLVYERLTQGMTEAEISRDLNYSKQRINQIKKSLIDKLNPYFGDTNAA